MSFKTNILTIFLWLLTIHTYCQNRGFKKDSLQIKAYTEIIYKNNEVKEINVLNVFCDYCDENQIRLIKLKSWQETYLKRYDKKYKVSDGKAKLALYIRVDKEEFRAIREN